MNVLTYSAALALAAGGAAAQTSQPMPMDTPTTVNGIETVCTGVGEEAQNDPRWAAYPARVEFSNGGAQYLSGAIVNLASASGKPLASVNCPGAWVLFHVEPGTYKVTATLTGQPGGMTSATFTAPRSGQKRIVLDFAVKPNQ